MTQKSGVVTRKLPGVTVTSAKVRSVQSKGKGIMSPTKLAPVSLQKEPESSETDSSDSSECEDDGKQAIQVKKPFCHPGGCEGAEATSRHTEANGGL